MGLHGNGALLCVGLAMRTRDAARGRTSFHENRIGTNRVSDSRKYPFTILVMRKGAPV